MVEEKKKVLPTDHWCRQEVGKAGELNFYRNEKLRLPTKNESEQSSVNRVLKRHAIYTILIEI